MTRSPWPLFRFFIVFGPNLHLDLGRLFKIARGAHLHSHDRLTMPDETSGSERKLKIPIARLREISMCDNGGERGHWDRECPKPPRARLLEPSLFTHFAPKAVVAAVSNHAMLAADDSHNFLTLPVGGYARQRAHSTIFVSGHS